MARPGTRTARRRAPPPRDRIDFARATHVPRAGIEDVDTRQRRARWMRRWVWLGVLLAPIAALAIIVAVAGLGAPQTQPDGGTSGFSPPTVVASARLLSWLDQPVPPVPEAMVLGHAGSEIVVDDVYGPSHADGPEGVRVHVETFVVASEGRLYEASLEVFAPPDAVPTVSAGPSLVALATGEHESDAIGWTEVTDLASSAAAPIEAAVDRWARALLSGDAETLRLATGDGDATRSYLPLPVTPVGGTRVLASGTRSDGVDRLVARVAIDADWSPASGDDANDDVSDFEPLVYDVLVERATTATPVVVAWGGPGTGTTLQPYDNAVPIESVPPAPSSSAGTADPSSDGDAAGPATSDAAGDGA